MNEYLHPKSCSPAGPLTFCLGRSVSYLHQSAASAEGQMMVEAHRIATVSFDPNPGLQNCPIVQVLGKGKEMGLEVAAGVEEGIHPTHYPVYDGHRGKPTYMSGCVVFHGRLHT